MAEDVRVHLRLTQACMGSSRDRSPPRDSYSGRRSPMGRIPKISSTSSLDDLRSEFNRITDDTPLKMEDMTWEKMGSKVQDMCEARANGMSGPL